MQFTGLSGTSDITVRFRCALFCLQKLRYQGKMEQKLSFWQKRLAKRILDNNVVDDSFIETVYSEFKKEVANM